MTQSCDARAFIVCINLNEGARRFRGGVDGGVRCGASVVSVQNALAKV